MKFATSAMAPVSVEFLCSDDFVAIPIKQSAEAKAGAVLTVDGATGLCLYAIDPAVNPNGALLIEGVVDEEKVKALSGVSSIDASDKAKMPRITFRTNIGVNA